MKVPVSINQQVDGYQYDGNLQIGERKFDWEVHFGQPVDAILSQRVKPEGKDAVRKLFNVGLKIDGKKVDVDEELFMFLLGTVV
ncbi:MAG: hypothetical protein Q7S72_00495, partial [Candidatus Taylorbacteria bacterium]|nr:hypothetical protein [Candidatus Taylorbacteria bacterium]